MQETIVNPLESLAKVQHQMQEEMAKSKKAMADACLGVTGSIPYNLEQSAVVIKQLRSERDQFKKLFAESQEFLSKMLKSLVENQPESKELPSLGNVQKLIKRVLTERNEALAKLDQSNQLLPEALKALVAGQPEDKNPPTVDNVVGCVSRLNKESKQYKTELDKKAIAIDNLKATLIDKGLKEFGADSYFVDTNTPLIKVAEATVLSLHGNVLSKQAYLRNRGWDMVHNNLPNGGWRKGKDLMPFDAAFNTQVREDAAPFIGLVKPCEDRKVIENKPKSDDQTCLCS
jgi:hypothetical protein